MPKQPPLVVVTCPPGCIKFHYNWIDLASARNEGEIQVLLTDFCLTGAVRMGCKKEEPVALHQLLMKCLNTATIPEAAKKLYAERIEAAK